MRRTIRAARLSVILAAAAALLGCQGSMEALLISNESDHPLAARLIAPIRTTPWMSR
jgi:hypothetical protein